MPFEHPPKLEKTQTEKDWEYVNKLIDAAQTNIEREFKKGKNPWFACFRTVVTGIQGYLELIHGDKGMTTDALTLAKSICKDLAVGTEDLLRKYPVGVTPPPEAQTEWIDQLKLLRKEN